MEELDRHVLWFPPEVVPVWRVVKSEERLAEERLAGEVEAVKVNRSESRARTSPAPLVPVCDCGWPVPAKMVAADRRRRRAAQTSLFPDPDVGPDGRKRG